MKPKTIRLYPVPGVSVYPYPAEAFDATPDEVETLLAYNPPPFTTTPPEAEKRPKTDDKP